MTKVRLNIFAYVMLTMAFFWGVFGGTQAWQFSFIYQFVLFSVLVIVWSLGSMAMMTWSALQKVKDAERAQLQEDTLQEREVLGEPPISDELPLLTVGKT